MQETIKTVLDGITIGTPVTSGPLAIVPLFRDGPSAPACKPLDDALRLGEVEITEAGAGSVPTLIVINKSETSVLIMQGDELLGGMQNRIVNNIRDRRRKVGGQPPRLVRRGRQVASDEPALQLRRKGVSQPPARAPRAGREKSPDDRAARV